MIDVNIVAGGSTAELIKLECQRLGLSNIVSDNPINDAGIYVCVNRNTGNKKLTHERTIVLEEVFLLEEFREKLISALGGSVQPKQSAPHGKKRASALSLDEETKCVKLRGNEIPLSPTEFKIFELLNSRRGETVTHEEINLLVNGKDTNKVNVYVCHLRKKLEAKGDKIIYSIRGKGFMIK